MMIAARWHDARMTSRFAVLVLVLATLIAPVQSTYAQSGDRESITMSPTSRLYTIDTGKSITDKLTVVNDGTTSYDFLVYARPYSIQDNRYDNPNFTAVTPITDLYSWVQFPQAKVHIEAGATKEVPFTVNVPAGAAPGGHYGVIFAEIQPVPTKTSGNSVVRKKRVGTVIYATVNGAVTLTGDEAAGTIPFWQFQPPLHTTVAAQNTGNTHFTDTVKLTVRDVLGNIKYQSSKEYQVLPGTTRTVDNDWTTAPWFGFYKVETEQKFLDKSFQTGGYVLIMPRYIPIALLVTLLIAGGVYVARHRRKKQS